VLLIQQDAIIFSRALQVLQNKCDEAKAKFSEIEQQDVKCREDLKHAKAQTKKLERSLDQEKNKVPFPDIFNQIIFA
jgi:IS1 family transposase